jgi:hypothetical protein
MPQYDAIGRLESTHGMTEEVTKNVRLCRRWSGGNGVSDRSRVARGAQ